MQLNLSQIQPAPLSRSEAFFSLLYGQYMKQYPKRSGSRAKGEKRFDQERQWVYVGPKEKMKSVATKATLYAVLADPNADTTYFTPNGYFRRDQRWTEHLRWLNAFIFDMDNYGESIQDVLERIDSAGLPRPTSIVETPSGGHHVGYFFTKPIRATEKTIRLYSAIMWHLADDLGADLAAVGANRVFRTPTEKNLLYFAPENRYSFDFFKDWRDINHPFELGLTGFVNVDTNNLMNHPALIYLLEAPCQEGLREKTAFNLALAMKASDWSKEQAVSELKAWYHSCCEKGSRAGKKPFTERDAEYKARYVFSNDKLHAPKAEVIRELTGMAFYYQLRNHWVGAKTRSERVRSHLHEWEADLLALLETEKELSGTQQELADRLQADGHTCPLTSFRAVLRKLKNDGKVIIESSRGRGGKTIIRLPEPPQDESAQDKVIDFPQPVSAPANANREVVIVHTDFVGKKVTRIERKPSNVAEPEAPEPGPPD